MSSTARDAQSLTGQGFGGTTRRPATGDRKSKSHSTVTPEEAQTWIEDMTRAASGGLNPAAATQRLAEYGKDVMPLATRGLERKTLDPYLAGWRLRVVPTLGHIPTRMLTNGVVDRAVYGWIADECSRSARLAAHRTDVAG